MGKILKGITRSISDRILQEWLLFRFIASDYNNGPPFTAYGGWLNKCKEPLCAFTVDPCLSIGYSKAD